MLKTMQIKLNYMPESWGIRIEGNDIRAFILWRCVNKDLCIFGDDQDVFEECVRDFSESMVFDDLKKAYKWVEERIKEK